MLKAAVPYCTFPRCPNRAHGKCPEHQQQHARVKDQTRVRSDRRLHTHRWKVYSRNRLAKFPLCIGWPVGMHRLPTLAQVTDHRKPAKACTDSEFWDPSNHDSLCQDCNKRKGIAEEGGLGR
jgi:5-methylcytosine-specific restriction protein A